MYLINFIVSNLMRNIQLLEIGKMKSVLVHVSEKLSNYVLVFYTNKGEYKT